MISRSTLIRYYCIGIWIGLSGYPLLTIHGQSQICTGSLGENIFTEGDFGSGTDNFIRMDPGIAPGYTYTTNPPPADGFYTISNNTGRWSNLYPTWMVTDDNSSDPNGYMMVVNASFTPGLFYNQVVDGLCENTLYEFSADILNVVRIGVGGHSLPNVSFLIDSVEVFSTGGVPQNETWQTYGFTFSTEPGQTSVQLSLRNNAPGGIGNDLALDNITFRPCGPEAFILPETVANICEDGDPLALSATVLGDQFENPAVQWQRSLDSGDSWEDIPNATDSVYLHTDLFSGFYYYRFLLASAPGNLANDRCRVVSNVKIVRVVPKFYQITDTICEGLNYTVGPSVYTASGNYTDSLISSIGCDSIVFLNLTVVNDPGIEATFTIQDLSCHNVNDGSIEVSSISFGNGPYTVTLENETSMMAMRFDSLDAGNQSILITDRFGCSLAEEIVINAPEPFVIDAGNDTTVLMGEEVLYYANANYPIQTVDWGYGDRSACIDNCLGWRYYPLENFTYLVTGVSDQGCLAFDTFTISVIPDRTIQFPNVFSPNGDGINDFFNGFGRVPNILVIEELSIYDRWGTELFRGFNFVPNEPGVGWDGRSNGQWVDSGVYVYRAQVRFLDDFRMSFAGDITLMK